MMTLAEVGDDNNLEFAAPDPSAMDIWKSSMYSRVLSLKIWNDLVEVLAPLVKVMMVSSGVV